MIRSFAPLLLDWYADNARELPWVSEKDPYRIWLSEVIMQQTRVRQGLAYYDRFTRAFPDVHTMANAPEERIMKLWEGLGYYSRARNMHAASKVVVEEFGGIFPSEPSQLQKLPGVGPYTARAIASFAFGRPYAVTDGNVFRILSRVFGVDDPIDTTNGKKVFQQLADEVLFKKDPGRFNQAMMDFGSLVCTPRSPSCGSCPFSPDCVAREKGEVDKLPVKSRKVKRSTICHYYLVLKSEDNQIVIRQRPAGGIWRNLYEFPGVASDSPLPDDAVLPAFTELLPGAQNPPRIVLKARLSQELTHRTVKAFFYLAEVEDISHFCPSDAIGVELEKLPEYPYPVVVREFLNKFIYI